MSEEARRIAGRILNDAQGAERIGQLGLILEEATCLARSYLDLEARLQASEETEQVLREALEMIQKIPSKETLLLHVETKAMWSVAVRALEGMWGKPYEDILAAAGLRRAPR